MRRLNEHSLAAIPRMYVGGYTYVYEDTMLWRLSMIGDAEHYDKYALYVFAAKLLLPFALIATIYPASDGKVYVYRQGGADLITIMDMRLPAAPWTESGKIRRKWRYKLSLMSNMLNEHFAKEERK